MSEPPDHRRRLAPIVVLVVAIVALVGTSPPTSVSERAEGDVEVGPGSPADIHVRFHLQTGDEPTDSIFVTFDFLDGQHDPRISRAVSSTIAGSSPSDGAQLHPEHCISECTVDATARLAWVGPDEPPLRVHWEAVLTVEFGAGHATTTATVVEGAAPSVPRGVWIGIGALAAVLTGMFFTSHRGRMLQLRSFLAAMTVPVLVWGAVASTDFFTVVAGMAVRGPQLVDILVPLLALVLAGAVAAGVWRAWHGRPSILRVVGWMIVPIAAVSALLIVLDLPVYRPHEIALASFVGGVPIAAAVTAEAGRPTAAPSVSRGTALVVACHALMFSYAVGLLVWLVLALIPATNILGSTGWETAVVAFLVTVGVLVLFVEGVRRWTMGDPRLLLLADLPFLVLTLAAAGISLVVGGDGLLVPLEIETKSVLIAAAIVAFTGALGLAVVAPPVVPANAGGSAPDEHGNDESGQGD